jgi:hypothetical protein
MDSEKRLEWLKSLKKGDKVLVMQKGYKKSTGVSNIVVVEGNYDGRVLIGERLFDETGNSPEIKICLEPITEDYLVQAERDRVKAVVTHYIDKNNLSAIQLLFNTDADTSVIKHVLHLLKLDDIILENDKVLDLIASLRETDFPPVRKKEDSYGADRERQVASGLTSALQKTETLPVLKRRRGRPRKK